MKYFIIAGEASGDLHGANLVKELRAVDDNAEIQCWGGDKMSKAGAYLLKDYRDLAIMGFWEVLIKLRSIFTNLRICTEQVISFKPDIVILIDYPGFNLRIARRLKKYNTRIYYYISPKVWAWKSSRIKKIKEYIDRMYVIFPFEPEFFSRYNYNVHYFGNPLVEHVEGELEKALPYNKLISAESLDNKPLIALLAGSRTQEVKKILPAMASLQKYYPDYMLAVAGVRTVDPGIYTAILKDTGIEVVYDRTYDLLRNSEAAMVTSGTATLEAAIAGIPQVVCYRTSWLSYRLARMLVKIRFISLVNLIMDREIVKELIQHDLNEKRMVSELNSILPGGWKREVMLKNYAILKDKLSGKGASERIAVDIYTSLKLVENVN